MKELSKLFITILPVFFPLHLNAQVLVNLRSTLNNGGSSEIVMTDGHQYYLQQSIGQPAITGLVQYGNYQLWQGFIQPIAGSDNYIMSDNLQATIFPNPFSGNIYISFYDNIPGSLYVALYDLNGKIVYFNKHVASSYLILNAGHLLPGVYFIRVSTITKNLYTKVIKH